MTSPRELLTFPLLRLPIDYALADSRLAVS